MALYRVAIRTAATGAGAAIADLRTAAGDRAFIREIGAFVVTATASSVGIIRPATLGTTSTTTVPQAGDPADPAATALLGSVWSAAPTISTNVYHRRILLPATIGAGVIWTFGPRDLVVPVSSSLLLWNFGAGANAALDLYIDFEE